VCLLNVGNGKTTALDRAPTDSSAARRGSAVGTPSSADTFCLYGYYMVGDTTLVYM
jgi:hypothetical protein